MMGGIDMTDVPVDGRYLPRLNAIDYTITLRNTTTPYPYDREWVCPYQPVLSFQDTLMADSADALYYKQLARISFEVME